MGGNSVTVEDTDVERNLMPEHLYRVDGEERVLEAIGITCGSGLV